MSIAHVQHPPVPPSLRSEVPIHPSLERIVLKCLEKNPDDRPQNACELLNMLENLEGLEPWTRGQAHDWWQAHLPESSTLRSSCEKAELHTPEVVQVA